MRDGPRLRRPGPSPAPLGGGGGEGGTGHTVGSPRGACACCGGSRGRPGGARARACRGGGRGVRHGHVLSPCRPRRVLPDQSRRWKGQRHNNAAARAEPTRVPLGSEARGSRTNCHGQVSVSTCCRTARTAPALTRPSPRRCRRPPTHQNGIAHAGQLQPPGRQPDQRERAGAAVSADDAAARHVASQTLVARVTSHMTRPRTSGPLIDARSPRWTFPETE